VEKAGVFFHIGVMLASTFRMLARPKNLANLLAFTAGQMSWGVILGTGLVVGPESPAFRLVVVILGVISVILWIFVVIGVIRLAILGGRLYSEAGSVVPIGELPPPEGAGNQQP
jgi:hypothetical protein